VLDAVQLKNSIQSCERERSQTDIYIPLFGVTSFNTLMSDSSEYLYRRWIGRKMMKELKILTANAIPNTFDL
jgi:hypothetical protein